MFLSSNWKGLYSKATAKSSRKRKRRQQEAATGVGDTNSKRRSKAGGGTSAGKSRQNAIKTAVIAMDCEMVGVGKNGKRSMLARCSIVNFRGEVLYDKYVEPMERVTDYRTEVSGITPELLAGPDAVSFRQCQKEVASLLERRVLVGHSLENDLKCLFLTHPKRLIRDTAYYKPLCPKRPKALKKLVKTFLGRSIQTGEHSSVVDAVSTLDLYKRFMDGWEKGQKSYFVNSSNTSGSSKNNKSSKAASSTLPLQTQKTMIEEKKEKGKVIKEQAKNTENKQSSHKKSKRQNTNDPTKVSKQKRTKKAKKKLSKKKGSSRKKSSMQKKNK